MRHTLTISMQRVAQARRRKSSSSGSRSSSQFLIFAATMMLACRASFAFVRTAGCGPGAAGNLRGASPIRRFLTSKRIASDVKYRVPVTELPEPDRLLIIGDVHGDLNAFHSCLKMAGVIDADMQWSGGKTVLVQCGDVFDRGECDLEVEEELYRLGEQAEASGGTCISLLGNHEVMNACGDHSMAVRKAFEPFQELRPDVDKFLSGDWDILAKFPDWAKCRIGAMLPAGPVAKLLAGHPLALKVGKTLVVHGGLLPQHVPSGIQSLHDMNTEAFEWLVGIKRTIPDNLMREESPIWTRKYSSPNDMELGEEAASDLKTTLDLVGCDRMVVGHTPQRRGINAAASGQVWRVDTGMTQMMGGAAEVLEILNGTVARIITADGPLEGEELQRLRYAPRGAPIGRFVKNSSTSSGE